MENIRQSAMSQSNALFLFLKPNFVQCQFLSLGDKQRWLNRNAGLQLALVLGMVTGIHFVEAYLLNPAIYAAHLQLHPLLVLSVLVIAEHSLGVWGLLLAGDPFLLFSERPWLKKPTRSPDVPSWEYNHALLCPVLRPLICMAINHLVWIHENKQKSVHSAS